MTLENQVVSLQLSKRLHELGVKQSAIFNHVSFTDEMGEERQEVYTNDDMEREYAAEWKEQYAAFTVAELGEDMNIELTDANESDSFTLKITNAIDFWCVSFGNDDHNITPQFENPKLADALAELCIYLIENKLMEV